MLNRVDAIPWEVLYFYNGIKKLLLYFQQYYISHVYREGNSIADMFANHSISTQTSRIFDAGEDIPKHIRGELRLNRNGIPAVRRRILK